MQTEELQELIKVDAKKSMFRDAEDIPPTLEEDKQDDFASIPSGSHSPEPKNNQEQLYSVLAQSTAEMIPRESKRTS